MRIECWLKIAEAEYKGRTEPIHLIEGSEIKWKWSEWWPAKPTWTAVHSFLRMDGVNWRSSTTILFENWLFFILFFSSALLERQTIHQSITNGVNDWLDLFSFSFFFNLWVMRRSASAAEKFIPIDSINLHSFSLPFNQLMKRRREIESCLFFSWSMKEEWMIVCWMSWLGRQSHNFHSAIKEMFSFLYGGSNQPFIQQTIHSAKTNKINFIFLFASFIN